MTAKTRLLEVFNGCCQAVQPGKRIEKVLSVTDHLWVRTEAKTVGIPVDSGSRIIVYSIGKASIGMMDSARKVLGARLHHSLAIAPSAQKMGGERGGVLYGAANNLPDDAALAATETILQDLKAHDQENTIFLFLISGGGSALFCAPEDGVTIEQKLCIIREMVSRGASINQLNIVRQSISKVKGGKILEMVSKGKVVSLILSDIVGDPIELIASGPTVPNSFTEDDVTKVLSDLNLPGIVPKLSEKKKINKNAENIIISSNKVALAKGKELLEAQGFHVILVTSTLEGNATEIGQKFAEIIKNDREKWPQLIKSISGTEVIIPVQKPIVLLFGGETTVVIKGNGKGGRNQEMVLSCLASLTPTSRRFIFASLGTDGQDGPTDAAGAIIDQDDITSIDHNKFLSNNDSYTFWQNFKDGSCLVKTGPTGTNVMDLQFLIIPD